MAADWLCLPAAGKDRQDGNEFKCVRFNGHTVTLVAEPLVASAPKRQLVVESDGPFQLQVVRGERKLDVSVQVGKNVFEFE